jgi:hypothetical protein
LRLSFEISTTAELSTLTAQIGHSSTPYTIDFTIDDVAPVGPAMMMSHPFVVPPAGDTLAGVVFLIESAAPAVVCVDNVYVGPP